MMKAVEFVEQNVVMGQGQPEYLPLPAHRANDGRVIACFEMDEAERAVFLETGRVWLHLWTSGGPMQPVALEVQRPFEREEIREEIRGTSAPAELGGA